MRTLRLAELFFLKYAETSPDVLEASIRSDIDRLWSYPNKLFNILSACAKSDPRKPNDRDDHKAIEGFKFCQNIVSIIDYLQAHNNEITLGEIKEDLLNIVHLIQYNISAKFDEKGKQALIGESSNIQFPHVSELIFRMIPVRNKHDKVRRDQQYSKAKTGLSRILSFSLSMLEKLSKLEMMVPEKFIYEGSGIGAAPLNRFSPQRAPLSIYDIIDFIRRHGDEYGIPTNEDWGTVFTANPRSGGDPQLKEEMTTIINAINRGHYPLGSADMKMEIARILKEHEERKSNNAKLLEEI